MYVVYNLSPDLSSHHRVDNNINPAGWCWHGIFHSHSLTVTYQNIEYVHLLVDHHLVVGQRNWDGNHLAIQFGDEICFCYGPINK